MPLPVDLACAPPGDTSSLSVSAPHVERPLEAISFDCCISGKASYDLLEMGKSRARGAKGGSIRRKCSKSTAIPRGLASKGVLRVTLPPDAVRGTACSPPYKAPGVCSPQELPCEESYNSPALADGGGPLTPLPEDGAQRCRRRVRFSCSNAELGSDERKRQTALPHVPTETLPPWLRLGRTYGGFCHFRDGARTADVVPRIDGSAITPREFHARFVKTRRPCVIRNSPDFTEVFRTWASDEFLRKRTRGQRVLVEVAQPASRDARAGAVVFGAGRTRRLVFDKLLDSILSGSDKYYMTTQKIKDTEDGPLYTSGKFLRNAQLLSPELLNGNFALKGNLQLYQVNMWFGNSRDGTSTGLHHDYHDNFYVVIRGRKKFRLFSPRCAEALQVSGTIRAIHANGLIAYDVSRADGADPINVVNWRLGQARTQVKALSERFQAAVAVATCLRKLCERVDIAVQEPVPMFITYPESTLLQSLLVVDRTDDEHNLFHNVKDSRDFANSSVAKRQGANNGDGESNGGDSSVSTSEENCGHAMSPGGANDYDNNSVNDAEDARAHEAGSRDIGADNESVGGGEAASSPAVYLIPAQIGAAYESATESVRLLKAYIHDARHQVKGLTQCLRTIRSAQPQVEVVTQGDQTLSDSQHTGGKSDKSSHENADDVAFDDESTTTGTTVDDMLASVPDALVDAFKRQRENLLSRGRAVLKAEQTSVDEGGDAPDTWVQCSHPHFCRLNTGPLGEHLPHLSVDRRSEEDLGLPNDPADVIKKYLSVTVEPGEILYLPASWFHEVISQSLQVKQEDGKQPCGHLALQYWFYPPAAPLTPFCKDLIRQFSSCDNVRNPSDFSLDDIDFDAPYCDDYFPSRSRRMEKLREQKGLADAAAAAATNFSQWFGNLSSSWALPSTGAPSRRQLSTINCVDDVFP